MAPLFLLLTFGATAFGAIMSASSAVQQLVAESARATMSGLSDAERDRLARDFVAAHLSAYPLLDSARLVVSTGSVAGTPPAYAVTLTYDMSKMFAFSLLTWLPLPAKTVVRSAVVQYGGF